MVIASKAKSNASTGFRTIQERNLANKKLVKDFKIYSEIERKKSVDDGSCVDPSRKSLRTAPRRMDPSSKILNVKDDENFATKCDKNVPKMNVKNARKPLADVGNANNGASSQKTSIKKTTRVPRISLAKAIQVSSGSIPRTKLESGKVSAKVTVKLKSSVESTKTKPMSERSKYYTSRKFQSSVGLKPHKNEGSKIPPLRRSTLGTQKIINRNSLSKKASGINEPSKAEVAVLPKQPCSLDDSSISNEFRLKDEEISNKKMLVPSGSVPEIVQSEGNCCLAENITATISRPKHARRKSYTMSLVSKSEIIGQACGSAKKSGLPNIDDKANPLEVAEYVDDIYQYYWSMEVLNPLPADYMTIQLEITPGMRGILVDWLIEVHHKFRLMEETLFLMVELIDRVLSLVPTSKNDLQMVGLTALLLASKYEDYWHPKINELISISVNLCTRDQLLAMEKLILAKLKFRLNIPTPYVFMLRFLKAAQSDKKLECLAFYLIELCLVEYEALKFKPSLLCASAIYLARCTLQLNPTWTLLLRKHAQYEESEVRACAEMILRFQRTASQKKLKTTYSKFLSSERCRVAAIEAIDFLPDE